MQIERLLSEITLISKKFKQIYQKTGGYFNIFDITGIEHDEVKICRVIYELLNPKGSHYQGAAYLDLFLKHVLKITDFDLKFASVYREYVICNNRRIDLVIQNENYLIPIEVKIYAGEQENQCADYFKIAQNSNVYYLTLFGTSPSSFSTSGLTRLDDENYKEVTAISFSNDILKWLNFCLQQRETLAIGPIREVLLQLISVVRKLTGQMEEGKGMEIKELLMQSSENMKSAITIEQSLNECKTNLLQTIFTTLEEKLRQKGMQKVLIDDYDGDRTTNFYLKKSKKLSALPGISYMFKPNIKKDMDIILHVGLEDALYCGYCIAYKKESGPQRLTEKEIKHFIPHVEPKIDNWWAYWEYLPIDDENEVPYFEYFNVEDNDLYFKLYDEGYFNYFIDSCVNRISQLYEMENHI